MTRIRSEARLPLLVVNGSSDEERPDDSRRVEHEIVILPCVPALRSEERYILHWGSHDADDQSKPLGETPFAPQKLPYPFTIWTEVNDWLPHPSFPRMNARLPVHAEREVDYFVGLDLRVSDRRIAVVGLVGCIRHEILEKVVERERSLVLGKKRRNPVFASLVQDFFTVKAEERKLQLPRTFDHELRRSKYWIRTQWPTIVVDRPRQEMTRHHGLRLQAQWAFLHFHGFTLR